MEMSVQLHVPAAFIREWVTRLHSTGSSLSPTGSTGHFGEKENPISLRGMESTFLGDLARSLVTTRVC